MGEIATTKCADCGAELEHGDWPFCGGKNNHASVFNVNAQRFDPVVIHRDAAGNVRYPGRSDAPVPKGFERVELRTVAEVRHFERDVDRKEAARFDLSRTRSEENFRAHQEQQRSDLRQEMRHMSNQGRDFARHAIEQNNKRDRGRYDAGFRVEALS